MVTTKRCAYGTCKNDSRYPERWKRNDRGEPVNFYHFPGEKRDKQRRQTWITACHRGDHFVCTKDSYVCSVHFVGGSGPSKEYPNPISAVASKEEVKRLSRKRKSTLERENRKAKNKKIYTENQAAKALLNLSIKDSARGKSASELTAAEALLDLKDNEVDFDEESTFDEELPTVFSTHGDKCTATDRVMVTESSAQTDSSDKLMKILFMEKVLNPQKICHYTGMTKECFDLIYNHIEAKSQRMNMWKGNKKTKTGKIRDKDLNKREVHSKLTPKEQFVFTLVRLRRNPSIAMLSDIFGISANTGSRIFISWVLFLNEELKFLLPFPTTADLKGITQPKGFKKFENLRAIIDCTEFYIEKPSKPSCQRATYSQYKSANTFKLLISMSPICHINFVSNLYSGSISDKEIVNKSGFLQELQPGDRIMADKGFNIQDLLALHDTHLIAPPVMRKGNVSAKASTATRRVATARVHIERIIRLLKLFTILKGVIPLTLKPYIDAIVKVCASLVNLQPSVIKSSEIAKEKL